MTRDSWIWFLAIVGAVVTYLLNQAPPWDWTYNQWLAAAAFGVGTAAGWLKTSPLPGENDAKKVNLSKIAPLVVLLLILPGLTGCAQSTKAKLQQADRSLVGVLQTLDTVEQQLFTGGTVDAAWHKRFSGYMVTALTAGQTFHQSVLAYKPGQQPVPVDIVMLTSAMRSAADLVRSLPASDKRDRIAAVIDTVAFVAQQILSIVLPPPQAAALMPYPLLAGGH